MQGCSSSPGCSWEDAGGPAVCGGQGQLLLLPPHRVDWALSYPADSVRGSKRRQGTAVVLQGSERELWSKSVHSSCGQPQPDPSSLTAGNQRMYRGTSVHKVLSPVLFLTKKKPILRRQNERAIHFADLGHTSHYF